MAVGVRSGVLVVNSPANLHFRVGIDEVMNDFIRDRVGHNRPSAVAGIGCHDVHFLTLTQSSMIYTKLPPIYTKLTKKACKNGKVILRVIFAV